MTENGSVTVTPPQNSRIWRKTSIYIKHTAIDPDPTPVTACRTLYLLRRDTPRHNIYVCMSSDT